MNAAQEARLAAQVEADRQARLAAKEAAKAKERYREEA